MSVNQRVSEVIWLYPCFIILLPSEEFRKVEKNEDPLVHQDLGNRSVIAGVLGDREIEDDSEIPVVSTGVSKHK